MAITCTYCGYAYNSDDAENCAICNTSFQSVSEPPLNNTHYNDLQQSTTDELTQTSTVRPPLMNQRIEMTGQNESASSVNRASELRPGGCNVLEGRISHIERNDERPPMDMFRFLSKLLIGIVCFIPFIGLFLISGGFSLTFAIIGFRSLSQLFNPVVWSTSIFELLELLVLRNVRGNDTVPIYRGMIEDMNDQEHAFIFRGPIRSGNIVVGHNVRLSGQRDRGTFITQMGMDLTSRSEIISTYRNPWQFILCVMVILYIVGGLWVYMNLSTIKGYFG